MNSLTLNSPVSELPGIGKFYSMALNKRGIRTAKDLIWILPTKCIETEVVNDIHEGNLDHEVAVNVTVGSALGGKGRVMMYCKTSLNQPIKVTFFLNEVPKIFFPKNNLCLHGVISACGTGVYKMTHPSWSVGHQTKYVDVSYGIAGVSNLALNKAILTAITTIDEPEWLDEDFVQNKGWDTFQNSLAAMHKPNGNHVKSMQRLKFDEACAYENKINHAMRNLETSDPIYSISESDVSHMLDNFCFDLTEDQYQAWQEIKSDLMSQNRMMRILYGDVGSGKTLVGFLALLMTYQAGRQAAILAPTEILANQHYNLIKKLAPDANIILLTRNSKKKNIYESIENENCIIVGTHALIQQKVNYKNLGLLVIDEQHRFGVLQRMIANENMSYNVLLMTATPIPRTMKLSLMGHIPVSKILSRPQKHREINVDILHGSKISSLIPKIKEALEQGDSVFWVCPNIQKEKKRDGMDVHTRSEILEKEFPGLVAMLHGKMSAVNKEEVLSDFVSGKKKILVSTTVIEVGVNIPHANFMVVENSEFFGMAQMYQLMGRVGRGSKPGQCYLVYQGMSVDTRKRLLALKACKSGIELAEQDMKIRGWGNILGTHQNGEADSYFKVLNIIEDYDVFILADKYIKTGHNPKLERGMRYLSQVLGYLDVPWKAG